MFTPRLGLTAQLVSSFIRLAWIETRWTAAVKAIVYMVADQWFHTRDGYERYQQSNVQRGYLR